MTNKSIILDCKNLKDFEMVVLSKMILKLLESEFVLIKDKIGITIKLGNKNDKKRNY